MGCSLPGFSVHGILQERILECVAISFSRGPSQPRDQTRVSCIAGRCFNLWASTLMHMWNKSFLNQDFPGSPVVGTLFPLLGVGGGVCRKSPVPGWGARIPHISWQDKKKKKTIGIKKFSETVFTIDIYYFFWYFLSHSSPYHFKDGVHNSLNLFHVLFLPLALPCPVLGIWCSVKFIDSQ